MKYQSDAMASIHETMEALHKAGAIGKQTMRHFDEACLTRIQPLKPKQIKTLRVGARREAAFRSGAQAPVPRREARSQRGRLKVGQGRR